MRSLKHFCACALLILAACSKDKTEVNKTMLALNLQSGGSVSSDTADDLYPQLVQPGNGTITLFFVSNRPTGSGCSATAYCIFVSQSVTGYSDGNAALPKFTDPVALNVAAAAVTSTNAQGIAAFYDGTVPGYRIVYSDNTNAVRLATLPAANILTGTLQAAAAAETGPSGARTGVVNGAINLGGMFYVLGDGGATQKKIQTATAGDAGTQACAISDNCRWITYIRSAGANGLDFLHISTDGLLYRSSGGQSRAAESFNKTLAKGGLKLTGLSSLGHGNSDLLLVSGNTGGQNDLYVLNTPIKTAVTVAGAPPPVGVAGAAPAPPQFHTFAGTAAGTDVGRGVAVTSDGGLAVVSTINADPGNFGGLTPLIAWLAAGTNLWVKKYSASGTLQWHTLLGSGSIMSAYTGIVKSSDGAIIIAASSTADVASLAGAGAPLSAFPGAPNSFWTIKLTNAGAVTWHTFGSQNDFTGTAGSPIVATNDGGAIVCGQGGVSSATLHGVTAIRANWISTWGDFHTIRYNSNGTVNWHTHAGANDANGAGATGCAFLQDGGVVVAGYVRSSSTGGTMFTQTPTPPAVLIEYAGPASAYHGYIIKYNATGGVVWHTFTGSTSYSSSLDVIELSDTSIIYSGYVDTAANGFGGLTPIQAYTTGAGNTRLAKLNSSGVPQWVTYVGESGLARVIKSSTGFYMALQQNSNHSIATGFVSNPIAAYTASGTNDIRVLSYNSAGTVLWHTYVGGAGIQNFTGGFALGASDEIYVTGDAVSGTTFGSQTALSAHTAGGTSDTWLFKMPSTGVVP